MIPNIVHFCFGMTPDFGGRPFSLVHYLSVRSAWEVLKPDCMLMHCAHEPTGEWWELAKPMLQVHRVTPVSGIYGFPASHPAHRADIIRLAALQAMGGIYLDTDVLVVRPFEPLMEAEFAAARELTAEGVHVGLCNAILLTQPGSRFGKLCLEGHDPRTSLWQGFRSKGRDENYVEYSVRYPCLLADLAPGLLEALPPQTFLWATWDEAGLAQLFDGDVAVPQDVYAIHLWESHAWAKYLSKLTPERIRTEDTTFNRLARPFLPEQAVTKRTSSKGAAPQALERMDAICHEADFVDARHQPARNVSERAKRWFRRSVRGFRDELTLPLRCQIEELDQRLDAISQIKSPLPAAVEPGQWVGGREVVRFGPLDGSDELLRRFLPAGDLRFVAVTGNDGEPAVVSWLAKRAAFHGVWATTSLKRAKQISEWSANTGVAVRAILAPAAAEELSPAVNHLFQGADILVLADPSHHLERWRQLSQAQPQIIMICGREDENRSAALISFAATQGMRLAGASPDETFRVYVGGATEMGKVAPSKERKIQTLYGQLIHAAREGKS